MAYLSKTVTTNSDQSAEPRPFRFRGLVLGESKTGKTTLFAATAPGKKLVIDLENRWGQAITYPDVEVLPILDLASSQSIQPGMSLSEMSRDTLVRAWDILVEINNELWQSARKGELSYDSICLDSLSASNRLAMFHILSLKKASGEKMSYGLAGAPGEHHWGPQMHILSAFLLSINALPCHVVVNGHMERFENRKTKESYCAPKVYGKTRFDICSWYDEVYETFKKVNITTGKANYFLRTVGYADKQFLGSSMNSEGRYWNSPFEVDLSEQPAGISKLIKLTQKGGQPQAEAPQKFPSSKPGDPVFKPGLTATNR